MLRGVAILLAFEAGRWCCGFSWTDSRDFKGFGVSLFFTFLVCLVGGLQLSENYNSRRLVSGHKVTRLRIRCGYCEFDCWSAIYGCARACSN